MTSRVTWQAKPARQAESASTSAKAQASGPSAFIDHRAASSAQRQLQKMADDSAQVAQHKAVPWRPGRAAVVQRLGGDKKESAAAAAGAGAGTASLPANAASAAPQPDRKADAKDIDELSDEEKGYQAATQLISSIPYNSYLDHTEGLTLVEIAKLPKVHEWLRLAMVAYEKAQTNPGAFAEHGDLKTLGLSGGCYEVSRVFSFLLNDIKGKGRTSIHTTGGQHADTTHTSVKAITFPPQYIDATWRQGNAQNFDGLDEDPRKNLEMVRITDEPPTMASINRAVREALGT